MMDFIERQTREQISSVLGKKIKKVPSHLINKFSRDEAVRALKQRITNLTGEATYTSTPPR